MQEGIFGKKKVHESLVREEGKGSYEMKSKSRNENNRESRLQAVMERRRKFRKYGKV